MELSIQKQKIGRHSIELPATAEVRGETIFNPAKFQSIYYRIRAIKASAERQWGKMNVVQMLNHLKVATGSGLKFYGLKDESSFLYRTIIKFLVVRVFKQLPKNAAAPKAFKTELNNNLDFETERDQALDILKMAYSSNSKRYPHPLFGIMTSTEWGRLVYRHFDHHLSQFRA